MYEVKNRKPAAELIAVPHEQFGLITFEKVHTLEDGSCVYLTTKAFVEHEMSAEALGYECGVDVYRLSDVHQWLNSDQEKWWTEKIPGADEPSYEGAPGFMAGFPKEFLEQVRTVNIVCAERDRKPRAIQAKFFLPSYTELTGESNCGVMEGVWWDAFREAFEARGIGGLMDRLRKKNAGGRIYEWWWQRSCVPWYPVRFRSVGRDGNPVNNGHACNPFVGLAVACVIE